MTGLILVSGLVSCGGGDDTTDRKGLGALGDSLTLRTLQCDDANSLPSCAHPEQSYAWQLHAVPNLGRGGDTCTPQEPYATGPHQGQPRGLYARLGELTRERPARAAVLAGFNDLGYAVPEADIVNCLCGIWLRLRQEGVEPIAMTYPRVEMRSEQVRSLNAAIRAAAQAMKVRLVDPEAIDVSTVDGLHPDEAGAKAIASLFVD